MRKFIVKHFRDTTTVQEADCEVVFCNAWELLAGEKKYKMNDGDVLMSWAVFDTAELALVSASHDLRKSMELWNDKGKERFDLEELNKQIANIKIKLLGDK
jgi:hypothetical protein